MRAPLSDRAALAILTFVNLFNYLDRFIVASLFESLRESLGLTDPQLGWLMSGFIIVYMLASPLFGYLGDRRRRTRVISAGVAIWSLATMAGGWAWNFASLFVARAFVGVGEAAYATITPALLSDYFPLRTRGRVFAVFFMAIPVGSALGYVVGGLIDKAFGWRTAFYVAGLPSLLLAALVLRLRDPERGAQDTDTSGRANPDAPGGLLHDYVRLLRNRTYLLAVLGYGAYTFALGGLAAWMPAFLERARGMARDEATVQFGAVVVVTGFVGTFIGGFLGDRLLRRTKQAYLWISGASTLLALPFTVLALVAEQRWQFMTAMVIAELLLFVSTGPINSAIVNVVPPPLRATALALSIFGMHILGDVPSPPLIGLLSAHSSLEAAMLVVPSGVGLAGVIWMLAALTPAAEK